jgi:MOSC domain-containing protein YiiM
MTTPLESRLAQAFPIVQSGILRWIGLRPARGAPMQTVTAAACGADGLAGDRYLGRDGKRAVTLLQFEHLSAVASLLGRDEPISPLLLRRNLVIAGINLLALKRRQFRIGEVLFEGTGPCEPCAQMEAALGPGGFQAMRGHGGLCARVIEAGRLQLGDSVRVQPLTSTGDLFAA